MMTEQEIRTWIEQVQRDINEEDANGNMGSDAWFTAVAVRRTLERVLGER